MNEVAHAMAQGVAQGGLAEATGGEFEPTRQPTAMAMPSRLNQYEVERASRLCVADQVDIVEHSQIKTV